MVPVTAALLILAVSSRTQAIRYLGRVNPSTKELTWPGTGVAFTFTGMTANISLSAVSGTSSFNLHIDGGEPTVISTPTSKLISTGNLAEGEHTVTLRKRSETSFGTVTIGDIDIDGTFSADEVPSRKIEIIGDSISVGHGLDGTLPCTDTALVQNNPKTYGALTAESLEADYDIIAASGKGVTRNYATGSPEPSPIMPQLYTRYGANDADNSYPFPTSAAPDVVVINLGTNDFSYLNVRPALNITFFADAFVDFVSEIRSHYPNAEYFLMSSPMLNDDYPLRADAQKTTHTNALKSVIRHLNSPKMHLVEWPSQGSDVGCDYHPNAATHAAGARLLTEAIKDVMEW